MLALSPGTFLRQRVKDVPRKRKPKPERQKGSPLGHCLSECLTLHDARMCKWKNSSEVKLMMRTFLLCRHGLVFRSLSYASAPFRWRVLGEQLSSRSVSPQETTAQFKTTCNQWRIQGEGPGGTDPLHSNNNNNNNIFTAGPSVRG